MRVGAFEVTEPVPELNEPHAFAVVPTWIDVGRSASLTLSHMEQRFGGEKLASLARPGEFYDFSRYRPVLSRKGESAEVTFVNAAVTCGRRKEGPDFVFLRLPEPHTMAETFVESVVELLKRLNVKRYILLGSVYDMVPYTRPLLVTSSASNQSLRNSLSVTKVVPSDYNGPTSFLSLIEQYMAQIGIEALSLIVHIPGYLTLDDDYRGEKRLLEVIGSLYGLEVPQEAVDKAREQEDRFRQQSEQLLDQQPELRTILKQLEDNYDARVNARKEVTRLSPEVEKFLKELNERF
ncbi:MAG: PAC2 family protein [Dehalococcoidales bacterium]|nr:PAC2 family protein [Dehalococcoidales bacterium]